ncbi:hypothetical protein QBC46DRAFT_354873 [Diplogelasinospora grovesii]|uniref:Uncharacterized protein n=1 Tax=Diplogelasinospora grovesii TaxID=303347 RepID=A0AAN6S4F6_9PEZI|nr:hypothetical protein QBC46DRAFT_354873 [Diplogelasinospora grovesii]
MDNNSAPQPEGCQPFISRRVNKRRKGITASRDLLSLFVSFRSGTGGCYCRGVDFLALIASTALCLGHINGRLNGGRNYSWLAHQRLSDRGMMERVLESMQEEIGDGIAAKIAGILGHLLVVEDDVANNHGSYKTNLSHGRNGGEREALECSGGMFESEGGKVLRIYIPHVGLIQIQCHAASDGDPASTTTAGGHPRNNASSPGGDSSLDSGQWFAPESKLSEDDWELQGVDIALFDSLFPRGISGDVAH